MGKSFTQFLLGIVAAMLLALPAQAGASDRLSRKAPGLHPAKNLAAGKYVKAGKQGEPFILAAARDKGVKLNSLQKILLEKEHHNAWVKGRAPWVMKQQLGQKYAAAHMGDHAVVMRVSNPRQVSFGESAGRHKGPKNVIESEEEVDENGIITAPDKGEHVMYYRTGNSMSVSGDQVSLGAQSGQIEVVVTGDGVYYFKDFVSTLATGAWVKGTRSGNTITVKSGQPVTYSSSYNTTLSIYPGTYNSGFAKEEGDFTLAIDDEAGTITLNDTGDIQQGGKYVGVFWDDDNTFSGYGDYNTVYLLELPVDPDLVVLPEGAEPETWYMNGQLVNSDNLEDYSREVQVAIVGDDVYVQGISSYLPQSWVKGTISGTTVTFPIQYMGQLNGQYNLYLAGVEEVGEDYQLAPLVMTYDAVAQTLTAVGDMLVNVGNDAIGYAEWYYTTVISRDAPEQPVVEPVEVPYYNSFETEEEWAQLTIIDNNGDQSTWSRYLLNDNNTASYAWNEANMGDDWLATPPVRLEAGKQYAFALDVWVALDTYAERIEVKMGTEATAQSLGTGQVIIAPSEVSNESPAPLENESFTVSETGYYVFGIHAISDADQFRLIVDNLAITEAVNPNAPAPVADLAAVASNETLAATISFTAPVNTASGQPLTGNLTKIELYRDGKLINTFSDVVPGTALTYTDEADDLTTGNHTYYVVAYNEAGASKKSSEASVFLIQVFTVPYIANFSDEATMAYFQILDANNDGSTWGWSVDKGAYYQYSRENAADDYLISMPVRLEAGKFYSVVVNARVEFDAYYERFEVLVGTAPTPDALNIVAIPATDVVSEDDTNFENVFSVPQSGNYYVAIHALSDADQYNLIVNSLTIDNGPEGAAPGAATALAVTPADQGAMAASVSFTAPTVTVAGAALTGTMAVSVLRNDVVVKTFNDVTPGQQLSFDDAFEGDPGIYTYQVIAANASGDGLKSAKAEVFIGTDQPLAPETVNIEASGLDKLLVSWDKVGTVGLNGGYVDPSKVTYSVWDVELVEYFGMVYPTLGEQQFGSVVDDDHLTIDFNHNEGEQGYTYFAVKTTNEYSTEDEGEWNLGAMLTGKPYDLPIVEGIEGKTLHYFWESNASLLVSPSSSDGDGVALILLAEEPGFNYMLSGKLNLAGAANPTLLFDVKSEAISQVAVTGLVDGQPTNFMQTAPVQAGYTTVKVPLSQLQQGSYAQVVIGAEFLSASSFDQQGSLIEAGDSLVIDNIIVVDLKQNDMAVELSAPSKLTAGKTGQAVITVTNKGEQAAKDYTVKLTCGNELIYEETFSEELGIYKQNVITADIPTTVFTREGDLTLVATVTSTGDEDLSNNEASSELTIVAPTVDAPASVDVAQGEDGKVTVSWDLAAADAKEVTEDFEDKGTFPEFSIAGLSTEVHTGMLGDWTFVDGNGTYCYAFSGLDVPNLGEPSAWIVMAPASPQLAQDISEAYGAHSGDQYLASFCTAEPEGNIAATDHWLISPELSGQAQTIKFFARALTANYGAETYQVLYSTTDKSTESFQVIQSVETSSTEWEEVSFQLPEGAKYFAIRHTSTDIFALFIDDITYTASADVPESFNIYVDGELVTNVTESPATIDVEGGSHTVSVTAVYSNGNESAPVSATISVDAIEQLLATGKKVDVYTVDGRMVRQQVSTLKGLKAGVYVIDNRKVVLK